MKLIGHIFGILFRIGVAIFVAVYVYQNWVSGLISIPLASMTIKDILLVPVGFISLIVLPLVALEIINFAERDETKHE